MGGITGIFGLEDRPDRSGRTEAMARRLLHRTAGALGGMLCPGPLVRLWQLGASPPSLGSDGSSLVFDGTIYNRVELWAEFSSSRESGDAGLALALFQSQGIRGLSRINGDFALAAYDPEVNALHLMRDRFGIRPLYLIRLGDEILFASEIKAFFASPEFWPEPASATLFDFLATHYRYIHRDPARTYFRNVVQVPPSHVVTLVGRSGRLEALSPRRWWRLELDPETTSLDHGEAETRLKHLVRESVALRLREAGPTGFSVSSGMDSSSVCSLATELTGKPQDLYSVTYGQGEYDETQGILPLVRNLDANWRNIVLSDPPLLDITARLVQWHDGPLCTVTWLSHYFMAQAAAEDSKTTLFSGLGGDECLAGEYEYFFYFFADLRKSGLEDRLDAEIRGWSRLHDHPVFQKNRQKAEDALRVLVDLSRPGQVLYDRTRYRQYLKYFDPEFVQAHDRPPDMPCPFESYLANRCYQDLFFETTPPSLTADEKNVSRFGATTRFPFLDHRVVTFCFSLSPLVKYDRGVTKAIMRKAMRGILPEANRTNTTKTGFNAPANAWLLGPERNRIWDLFRSRSFKERGWLRPGSAERLLKAHEQGRANHMMVLWQLISAELWMRTLSEARPESKAAAA